MAEIAQLGSGAPKRVPPSEASATIAKTATQLDSSAKTLTWWGDVWWRFSRQRVPMIAAFVLGAFVVIAITAPVITPYDPTHQFRDVGVSASGQPLPPNAKFWLGTDGLGRDLLSRLLFGIRTSMTIGLAGAAGAIAIAVLVGGIAGFSGKNVDFGLMRLVDLVLSVPTFFLILLLVVMLKPGISVVIFVIAIFSWAYPSRIFRSQVLSIRRRDFVLSAEAVGVPMRRIFVRHVLPHLLPLVIIYLTLMVPGAIFTEAGLSFVGLGVPPPNPSLGSMIFDGQQYYRVAPWIVLYPGITLALLVVSFNLVGTALRDAMDPQRRGK
jgi:peptide/nickel transport system permease protein